MSNENFTKHLHFAENGATLTAEQLTQLERDLIAMLYTIWRITGKRKKIVTVKDKQTTNP